MEVPLQRDDNDNIRPVKGVSILVLMEVPLQQPLSSDYNTLDGCFNPCFNGSSSSTFYKQKNKAFLGLFQSLF